MRRLDRSWSSVDAEVYLDPVGNHGDLEMHSGVFPVEMMVEVCLGSGC